MPPFDGAVRIIIFNLIHLLLARRVSEKVTLKNNANFLKSLLWAGALEVQWARTRLDTARRGPNKGEMYCFIGVLPFTACKCQTFTTNAFRARLCVMWNCKRCNKRWFSFAYTQLPICLMDRFFVWFHASWKWSPFNFDRAKNIMRLQVNVQFQSVLYFHRLNQTYNNEKTYTVYLKNFINYTVR